jgi:P27 family predicted phage terminase small subunit
VFSAYCQAFGRWVQAEEVLASMRARDPVTGALLVKTSDGARINPLVRAASHAAKDMVKYAAEFGLSASARSRIAAGPFGQPPPGKFDGLLG